MFGVPINLNLLQKDEYKYIKEKMVVSIKNLIRTEMVIYQACLYLNLCILQMCFGDIDLQKSQYNK